MTPHLKRQACSARRRVSGRRLTCTCQQAQEHSGLLLPSTTHLGCQNHQLRSAVGTNQFWADSGFFAPSHLQGDTVMLCSKESRPTVCVQDTDQRHVHCKLGSLQRQTIHNHFKSSRIRDRHVQVHVPHQHVADSSSCLPACPGSHTLQSENHASPTLLPTHNLHKSNEWPHRQLRTDSGDDARGSRGRGGGIVSRLVGAAVNAAPAPAPAWERTSACTCSGILVNKTSRYRSSTWHWLRVANQIAVCLARSGRVPRVVVVSATAASQLGSSNPMTPVN